MSREAIADVACELVPLPIDERTTEQRRSFRAVGSESL